MKHLLILTIGICLLVSLPVMADQAADEAAIREVMKQIYVASNNHDMETWSAFMDKDFENFSGTRKGRAANNKYWTEVFATRFKDAKYKQYEEIGIRFISNDVAVYKDRYEFSGTLDADGKVRPPAKWSSAWLLVKKDGKWLIGGMYQWPNR